MNLQNDRTLLTPTQFTKLNLSNRVALAPMTRISAKADGRATEKMTQYYRGFAQGGFSLLISEGLYTDDFASQTYRNQPGIATQTHTESWRPVIQAVHHAGAKFVAQLMHAGALSQYNAYGYESVGPSAVQPKGKQLVAYHGHGLYKIPKAASLADLDLIIEGFVTSAKRAIAAGFDGVEVHGANGYLLDQFLTDYTNTRHDDFGGSVSNRIRLMAQVVEAVRSIVPRTHVVGVRVSQSKVNDFTHKWQGGIKDAEIIFAELARAGADYIHTTEADALAPAFPSYSDSLAQIASRVSGLPVIANGGLGELDNAQRALAQGSALISLGKPALAASDWPLRAGSGQMIPEFDEAMLSPTAEIR